MNDQTGKDYSRRIITIPNILTLVRILLIPLFIWCYLGLKNNTVALAVLFASAVTDVADGWIARRWNMVSELGKAMDPVADKGTQLGVLACLVVKYPLMLAPLIMLVIKEGVSAVHSMVLIKMAGKVYQAEWHGKATTVIIYLTMALHLAWPGEVPRTLSIIMICLTLGFQIMSFYLYTARNLRLIKKYKSGELKPIKTGNEESE